MFGPLPVLHRILLVVAAILFFVTVGAWLGAMPAVPVGLAVGIGVGVALGALAAVALVHQSHHSAQPARVRRRHH